jgi:predicted dehydrogenase
MGLAVAEAAATMPDVDLIVGHRDLRRAEQTAARFGAIEATDDYASLARRDDLDILVTACRSSENPDLLVEAAGHGMHLISVKPFALSRSDATRVHAAVEGAGVLFFPWESGNRVGGRFRQIHGWVTEGRIGRPVSATYVMRSSVPRQPWPGESGETWWLDPAHVPGGGWIDHSIYAIDTLRWLFDAEVTSIGGIVARLVDDAIAPALEDYGLAAVQFDGGAGASVEVTWTAAPGAFYETFQLVGTDGSIMVDSTNPNRASVVGHVDPFAGRIEVQLPTGGDTPLAALIRAMRGDERLSVGVEDACRNLDACLTFYEASAHGRMLDPGAAEVRS